MKPLRSPKRSLRIMKERPMSKARTPRMRWRRIPLIILCGWILLEAGSLIFLRLYGAHAPQGYAQFLLENMVYKVHPVIDRLFFLSRYNRPNGWINSNAVFVFDRFCGQTPRPGIRYEGRISNYRTRYAHDQDGFMNTDPQARLGPKEKGEFRIFVLGGSTLMGVGASDMAHTIPANLKRFLENAGADPRLKVINAGVGGFRSTQEHLYLITKIAALEPDMVIVFDGANDADSTAEFLNGSGEPTYHSYGPGDYLAHYNFLTLGGSVRFLIDQSRAYSRRIADYSTFLVLVTNGFAKLNSMRAKRRAKNGTAQKFAADPPDQERVFSFYPKTISKIIEYCRSHGMLVACFLQPHIGTGKKQLHPREARYYPRLDEFPLRTAFERFSQAFSSLKGKYSFAPDVFVADYTGLFEETPQELYVDGTHYNDRGNEIIARQMATDIMGAFKNPLKGEPQ